MDDNLVSAMLSKFHIHSAYFSYRFLQIQVSTYQ